MSTASPYRTPAPEHEALFAATCRLNESGHARAVFKNDRLVVRERPSVLAAVGWSIGGVLVTLGGVYAAWLPVNIIGLVLGPCMLLGAVAFVFRARLVIDRNRVRGRGADMSRVDRVTADLASVRYERDADRDGVTMKLSLVPRKGDPIVVIDALDNRELASRVRAFGLGIAAWLRLDFVAEERDAGPPSKTLVRAGDALEAVLTILSA